MANERPTRVSDANTRKNRMSPERSVKNEYQNAENNGIGRYAISSNDSEAQENEFIPDAEVAPEHNVLQAQSVNTSGDAPVLIQKSKKKHPFYNLDYKNSVLLSFILYIGDMIAKAFRSSFTANIFTSFQRTARFFSESFLYGFFSNPKFKSLTGKVKKEVRKIATNAYIPASITSLASSLMKIKTRIYGLTAMSFSATTLLLHYFVTSHFDIFQVDLYAPLTASVILLFTVFLLIFSGTLSDMIKESYLLSVLFFGFLGIKRPSFSENEEFYIPASGACIFGVLLGILTLFFPAHSIIAVTLTAIYTFIVVKYPETGLISLLLIMPLLQLNAVFYIVSIITISYIFKIFTGKRTPDFEFADIFFAFFLLFSFTSDIFTYGTPNTLMSTVFILVYFLCICMLRDRTWFSRAINSIVLDSCIFAAYSVFVTFITRSLDAEFISYVKNTDYGNNKASALDSTSILGIVLICGMFFLLAYLFTNKSKSNRIGLSLLIVAAVIFIFRETSVAIQISLIISLALYLILKTNKTVLFLILGCACLPLLPLFNNGIASGLESLVKDEIYRVDIWSAVINMLSRYGMSGIGNSTEAFPMIYSSYYVGNTVNVPHAHSMLLQIAVSLGFIGLFLFVLVVFFVLQGAFSYGRNCPDKNSKNRLLCYAGMCSVVALTISSITENLMYNPRIMLIFWLMCGITVCARRSAKGVTPSSEFLAELEENYYG